MSKKAMAVPLMALAAVLAACSGRSDASSSSASSSATERSVTPWSSVPTTSTSEAESYSVSFFDVDGTTLIYKISGISRGRQVSYNGNKEEPQAMFPNTAGHLPYVEPVVVGAGINDESNYEDSGGIYISYLCNGWTETKPDEGTIQQTETQNGKNAFFIFKDTNLYPTFSVSKYKYRVQITFMVGNNVAGSFFGRYGVANGIPSDINENALAMAKAISASITGWGSKDSSRYPSPMKPIFPTVDESYAGIIFNAQLV